MATAMATYIHGLDRMQQSQHDLDDDLEECSVPALASASYPTSASSSSSTWRKGGSTRGTPAATAKSSVHDMKMVELKHSYDDGDDHQHQQHYASYDPSAQRWLYQDEGRGGGGGPSSHNHDHHHHHHHRRTAAAVPRRDLHYVPGERDHLLTHTSSSSSPSTQPALPGRHARSSFAPSASASSSPSTAAPIAFIMTASSSSSSSSPLSAITTTTTTTTTTTFSYASTSSTPSAASLASSAPSVLLFDAGSPPPLPSSLKKKKKKHDSKKHHHHHHHQQTTMGTTTAKKRVTWVDESVAGMRLEEVIEVERYLKQHGSLGWWLEMVWDNKPYFLLLLCIALLFLASVAFILYKLVF